MLRARISIRRITLTLLVAGVTGGSLVAGVPAQAAVPTAGPASADASSVVASLADRTAGSYSEAGHTVVTVTDASAAAEVRAAGFVARLVPRSGAQLAAARGRLESSARIAGTAWAVEPQTDQVVVSVDDTVTGARLAALTSVIAQLGDSVRVEHVAGRFATEIAGGDAIYGGQFRCSLGFNVKSGSSFFFLTAGHCGNAASAWFADLNHTKVLGSVVSSSFPGNDYALVRYTSSIKHPGKVDLYGGSQDVVTAGNASVGQSVKRSGSTTGVHSGTVTAVNATVNYAEGTVTGLIRTSVCAEPGDSGGSLFAGTIALGLTSGGSGNCTSGGTTFFQPVTEPLAAFGVSIF